MRHARAELLVAPVPALLIGGERLGTKDWIGGGMILAATLLDATSVNPEGTSA